MNDQDNFTEGVQQLYRLLRSLMLLFSAVVLLVIIVLANPRLLRQAPENMTVAQVEEMEDTYDAVIDGIHVRTGLKDGEGLMTVVNNCTNCHSAKIITQNRMNRERWAATIRWMQETQNLWDLGQNEDIIIDYLVANYPIEQIGRRKPLTEIEWYEYAE